MISYKDFPQVSERDTQRANDQAMPFVTAKASIYLRQLAERLWNTQAFGEEREARHNVAGALLLAADALVSSDKAWEAARANEHGKARREHYRLRQGGVDDPAIPVGTRSTVSGRAVEMTANGWRWA